jgi:hypothetical protein
VAAEEPQVAAGRQPERDRQTEVALLVSEDNSTQNLTTEELEQEKKGVGKMGI